jgi:hypothetical protein
MQTHQSGRRREEHDVLEETPDDEAHAGHDG